MFSILQYGQINISYFSIEMCGVCIEAWRFWKTDFSKNQIGPEPKGDSGAFSIKLDENLDHGRPDVSLT